MGGEVALLTPRQQMAFAALVPIAVATEKGTQFPAEALLAQWAVESDWGNKMTGDWNSFGLTSAACPDRPAKFCATRENMTPPQFDQLRPDERASVSAREDLGGGRYRYHLSRWFACFDNPQQACERYVGLLEHGRYAGAWAQYLAEHNLDALLDGIAKAGYASGSGYAALLKQIAHESRITLALQSARSSDLSA